MSKTDETRVIEHIFKHYENYLKEENGALLLIDPNDGKVIEIGRAHV